MNIVFGPQLALISSSVLIVVGGAFRGSEFEGSREEPERMRVSFDH
jgi:hypothetical protein